MTIAICGGTVLVPGHVDFGFAAAVGRLLAGFDCELRFGACPGYTLACIRGFLEDGQASRVRGLSPFANEDEHKANGYPLVEGTEIEYTGLGSARNALIIERCDAALVFPGSAGTVSEVCFALIGAKVILAPEAFAWLLTKHLSPFHPAASAIQSFSEPAELIALLSSLDAS